MSNSAVANIERLRNLSFIHLFAYLLQRSHITPEYLNIKNAIYISPLHGITQILTQLPIFTILHNIQFKSQSNQSIKIILTKLLVLGTCITAQIHIFALHDPEAQESSRLISIASIAILWLVVLFRTRSLSTIDAIKLESVAMAWTARYIYLFSGVFGYEFIEFATIYADISIVALFFGYSMASIVVQEPFQKRKEEHSTIENLWICLKIHNLDSLKQEVPPFMLESSLLLVETELDIVLANKTVTLFYKEKMQMKGTILLSYKGHKADAIDIALDRYASRSENRATSLWSSISSVVLCSPKKGCSIRKVSFEGNVEDRNICQMAKR
ncbi:hypothetical protein BCR33DRAFT_716814 [Rhizoclosmatium globosum]|uniref:Uncharacterized protein n=1 Tax=Rhizoclosmatium globosum TaxID=329046 RepID=A0A1Y2CF06_9FUNG|nr:hypothetical protein BCR33DRAFT_716814 [Rhizoclosmatium globosum]|eukprot:ORY44885.1 hypothetical protein BCR33DRAFT_716814 [Rhizoclosmatium globosum]